MSSINLYKIDESKKQAFYQELSNKMNKSKTITVQKENAGKFDLTLFSFKPIGTNQVKWNWLLRRFDEDEIRTVMSPSAVLLIEKEKKTTYAATFGHSFFMVDKYSDRDFGFSFARRIRFEEIKTTTLTTPSSKRNKTVNTYIDYDELEFDSGESFAKLKAKVEQDDEFSLFKPSLEIGVSIRFVIDVDSLERIVALICYVENTIRNEPVIYKIPVFSKVKDKKLIDQLNSNLEEMVKSNPKVSISELEIVGSTEVFTHNDGEYIIKYRRKSKNITSISSDELNQFCEENGFDFGSSVLDIQVQSLYEGKVLSTNSVRELIDVTDDKERCLLSRGVWYYYNDDYIKYLSDSIDEIKTEYDSAYDFTSKMHMDFVQSLVSAAKKEPGYAGKPEKEIISSLARKYYAERAFNMLMERDYGFQNFDRECKSINGAKLELTDLYKDGTMYAVKIGSSSAKLCYAIDQSSASLRLYKHKVLEGMPEIHTVALWFVLDRQTHIEKNGIPNINELDMLMLKNRIDQWKKEVRLLGYTPLIRINYKS